MAKTEAVRIGGDDPLASLTTRVIQVDCRRYSAHWGGGGVDEHRNPFGRLYWIRGGEGETRHHGKVFRLRPGHLFCIPAHTPGYYRCAEGMELAWLHFEAAVLGSLEPFGAFGWPFAVPVRDPAAVDGLYFGILERMSDPQPAARLEIDGGLRQLLARFARPVDERSGTLARARRFAPVLAYIEHHLAAPMKLAELAELAHLQPTYFSNLFSRVLGQPPMTYLTRRRIERAEALLLSRPEAKLQEVAERVGFQDVFHFSRTFKRVAGVPPSQYRERAERLDE